MMQKTDLERVKLLVVKRLAGMITEAEETELHNLMVADEHCRLLVERLLSGAFRAQAATDHHREDCRRSWHQLQRVLSGRKRTSYRMGWWPYAAAAIVAGVVFGWIGLKKPLAADTVSLEAPFEAVVYVEGLDAPQTIRDVYDFHAIRELLTQQMGHKLEARTTSQYTRVNVAKGKRYKVRLADGTWIYLNGESYLSVPASYSPSNRQIILAGDAHLDVSTGYDLPLRINTCCGDVRTLGGSLDFNGGVRTRSIEVCMAQGNAEVVSLRERQKLSSQHRALVDGEGYVMLHPNNDCYREGAIKGFWQNRLLDEQTLAYSNWN